MHGKWHDTRVAHRSFRKGRCEDTKSELARSLKFVSRLAYNVRKKIEAPGRLSARSVGTDCDVFPKLPRELMRPDARVTMRKPWMTWNSQKRVNSLSSMSLRTG